MMFCYNYFCCGRRKLLALRKNDATMQRGNGTIAHISYGCAENKQEDCAPERNSRPFYACNFLRVVLHYGVVESENMI